MQGGVTALEAARKHSVQIVRILLLFRISFKQEKIGKWQNKLFRFEYHSHLPKAWGNPEWDSYDKKMGVKDQT